MSSEQEQKQSISNPKYKEFKSLLDEDFKERKLKENEIIKATVTEITKNFIVVDCKAKMEGMIPIEEFKHDKEFENLKVGSTVEVYLERIESFKGEIVISREKAKRMVAWKKMEKIFETQEEVTGFVTGKVKGGYVCTVDGLPTFMPSSQIDVRPLKKIDHLMNVPIKVVATRIDKKRGNVCTSRRAVLEKSKNAELKEALKNLKEGDIVETAKVKATTDWGIFLDIDGIDALLHVSDLSYGRVKKPSDLVTIGQTLKVKITKIDKTTNRVSASIKALTEDPYENLSKKFKIGEIYEGTCTKLMDYGVFVKLEEGIEGLIHNSELSWQNRNVQPSKVLSPSQNVKVKIINIDKDAKRISLSYKETLDNPVGMLHMKDLIGIFSDKNINEIDIEKFLRDILFVPPSMKSRDLLVRMQTSRIHMALVIDEYGGTDGLVTIEDLIEEIIGEIEDELFEEDLDRIKIHDHYIDTSARTSIEEINDIIGYSLYTEDTDEEINTIGGLVFILAGRVPQRGELINHPHGFEIEITDADSRRIKNVRLRIKVDK